MLRLVVMSQPGRCGGRCGVRTMIVNGWIVSLRGSLISKPDSMLWKGENHEPI